MHRNTPKIIIYFPFPDLGEEAFNPLARKLNYNFRNSLYGLLLGYDKGKKYASFNAYREHVNQIKTWNEHLKVKLKKKIELHNKINSDQINYDIEILNYPENEESVKNHLSELKADDILIIPSHGNTDVIGVGPFTLDPFDLAQNLSAMGLSVNSTPLVMPWACNTGSTQDMQGNKVKSYVEKVHEILKETHPKSAVVGVAATIYPGGAKSKFNFFQETEKRNIVVKRRVDENKAFTLCVSPGAYNHHLLGIDQKDKMLTILRKINVSRLTSENIPKFDLNKLNDLNENSENTPINESSSESRFSNSKK